VINKGFFGLKAILITSHHNTGRPHFMVAINTVFLVGSNYVYIPYKISIFIFVIICLILRNKSQKHDLFI